MSAVAKERYRRYIRIGLHGSTNKLRISIPNEFHYPHTNVYAKVDLLKREVLLIPYSVGHADAVLYNFLNDPHNPGSRYVDVSGPSHGLGEAFAIAPTLFEMNRETGLLKVAIPAAEDRSPPNTLNPKMPEGVRQIPAREVTNIKPIQPSIVAQVAKTMQEGKDKRDAIPKVEVLVDLFGDTKQFNIPANELFEIMLEWNRRKYNA